MFILCVNMVFDIPRYIGKQTDFTHFRPLY